MERSLALQKGFTVGSFNVGCGISRLTAHEGDEVGFILLIPKETYPSDLPQAPATSTGYVYSTDLFEPYLPPVYGVYGDYGTIENVEESGVTRTIEAIFRRPVEAVLDAVGEDRGLYSKYSKLGELYLPTEIGETISAWGSPLEDQFQALGFTAHDAPEGFVHAYRYGDFELAGEVMTATGLPAGATYYQWTLTNHSTGEVHFSKQGALNGMEPIFSAFAVATGLMPGFDKKDWKAIRELQKLSGMFFLKRVYREVDAAIAADEAEWESEGLKRWIRDFEGARDDLNSDLRYSAHRSELQRRVGMRNNRAWRATLSLLDPEEYLEIGRLSRTMSALNCLFMPSFNGEQFGNDPASSHLVHSMQAILRERKKSWDEDQAEWGDEE